MPTIYVRDGADEPVNTIVADAQYTPAVTWLADGLHYVVVWTSYNGTDQDVRGRVFSADGTPVGNDDFVISGHPGEELQPQLAALSDGRFVVVWTDATGPLQAIFGQIFDATGAAVDPTPFLVSAIPVTLDATASEPSVAAFATGGGFVVSWTDFNTGTNDTRVLAQRFDSTGAPPLASSPIVVNLDNMLAQEQSSVAVLANGNFVVVWKDGSGQGGTVAPDIRMAIFQGDGTPMTIEDLLVNVTTTASTQEFPTVAALAGGGYVVAWTDYSQTGGDPDSSAIRAQVFNSDGSPAGPELLVNSTTASAQSDAQIAALPLAGGGGFVVSWTDASNGLDQDIRAQRFDADGQVIGAEFLVASDPSGDQAESALAASPASSTSGNLVVVSTDYADHLLNTDGDIEQNAFTLDNEPAVITGDTSGSVTEASGVANGTPGTPEATGNLDADDVDNPDDSWTAASGALTYGSYTLGTDGAWTYTLDDNNAAVQALNTGGTLSDSFTAATVDGTEQLVTITINGANDAAILSADARDLTETNSAVDISASGTLTISDVDSPATFVAQPGTVGNYGTFAINAAGAWTYTASSAHNEFVGGQTYNDTFSVASADGTLTSVTINILGINDPPAGVAHTLTFVEDTPHIFAAADFTYTDAETNGFAAVIITTLPGPGVGTIYFDADGAGNTFAPAAIDAGDEFTVEDLSEGRLTYVPALNANGDNYASFTYQVRDDGGTDAGGIDLDASADTITIDLTAVNDDPTVTFAPGGIYTTLEQVALDLKGSILVGDVDSDSVSISVTISAGGYGILTVTPGGSGADVAGSGSGEVTLTGTLAQIQALLVSDGTSTILYTPNTDNPPASTSLGVLVNDNGGSGEGGPLFVIGGQTITITPVNDAPSGIDHNITAVENTPRTLASNIFTFTDPEGSGLAAVTVSLPTRGTLFYDADGPGGNAPVALTATTTFTVAELNSFRLSYRAVADESGPNYATFTYIVRDDGGILNGGQDTDPIANTITIDVSGFNNAPQSTGLNNDAVTFFEDTPAGVVFLDDGRDAVITDLDSTDFDGGTLLVHIVANEVETEDQLVLITDAEVTLAGNIVSVNGVPIGTFAGGGLGDDMLFTFNSGATPASVSRLIHNLSYVNTNTVAPDTDLRIVEFRLADGDGSTMTAFTTISVVSVDDPATAGNDVATTDEATAVVIDVVANDDDIDGPPPSVAAVNGTAISVGSPVTLPTGAVVSLNPDGTLSYDPSGALDSTPTADSGAVNTPAPDSFTYTLALSGGTATVNVTVTGLDTNDLLLGSAGNDTLSGGIGNDTLIGNGGADTMIGGAGNDVYYGIDNAGDVVVEAIGGGDDVVQASVSYTLAAGAEIEVLTTTLDAGTGAIDFTGNEFANTIVGNAGVNILYGRAGNDVLVGLGGDDILVGEDGSDTLLAGEGHDQLHGGAGADQLSGGTGNDLYFISDASNVVIEAVSEGNDRVYASVSYALTAGAEIELLTTTLDAGTTAIDFTGNEFANTIVGNAGVNILYGRAGNDVLVGLAGNDILVGEDGNDTLLAGDGNDQLHGGTGADQLSGGAGNDLYFISDAANIITEAVSAGNDRVYASVSYALTAGAEVELLTTILDAATTAINLTGNAFADTIIGNAGANILHGGAGNDVLTGLGGDDILVGEDGNDALNGGEGNDQLHGGAGADQLSGGAGDDLYFISDASNIVTEAVSAGNDRVYASVSYALTAGAEVETLSTILDAATTAINLTGNAFANTIIGNAGVNILYGGAGNDVLVGLGGNDILVGEDGSDTLLAGDGNDQLHGGAGADQLVGGTGDDLYFISDASNIVTEAVSAGNDRVYASVSYALTAGAEVETLTTILDAATTAINLTGNAFANTITGNAGANILYGGAGNDVLTGLGGDDILVGDDGIDTLNAGEGNDQLHGGAGADLLSGGAGDDLYFVTDAADTVTEAVGAGNDTVYASVSYALTAGAEVETLTTILDEAVTVINLTGNELANTVVGNAGANILNGGGGNDVLMGLGGADKFAFTTALGNGNVDYIVDFFGVGSDGDDTIMLDHNIFTGLAVGALDPNAFAFGTAANDADDRIIYDAATGALYFDADGTGAALAIQFARIEPNTSLTSIDFTVI